MRTPSTNPALGALLRLKSVGSKMIRRVPFRRASHSPHRLEVERVLSEIAADLVHAPIGELDQAIDDCVERLGRFAGVDSCTVYRTARDRPHLLRLRHVWRREGLSAPHPPRELNFSQMAWIEAQARKREPIRYSDYDEITDPELSALNQRQRNRAGLVHWITIGEELCGCICYVCKDHARVWDETDAALIRLAAGVLGGAIARQRSDRAIRRQEERFRNLFERATIAAAVLDARGRLSRVNPAFARLVGREPDALRHLDLIELIHRSDARPVRRALGGSDLSVPETPLEVRLISADGSVLTVLLSIAAEEVGDTRHGYLVQLLDITERVSLEAQLQRAQRMGMVGQMSGGLAHDLKNQLTVVDGQLRRLEQRTDGHADLLADTRRMILQSSESISRVLALSRAAPARVSRVDVGQTTADVVRLVRRCLPASIELVCTVDGGPWHCDIDPLQLENALINLCFNARDAMHEDGGTLHVRVGSPPATTEGLPSSRVAFSITDDGVGMDPLVAEQALQPFYSTKTRTGGNGLGLHLVYSFVQQSRGKLEIDSCPLGGTRVQFTLPLARERPRKTDLRPKESLARLRNHRVLLTDDDPGVRGVVADLLSNLGCRVEEAASSRQALELLRASEPFDILLTDLYLANDETGAGLAQEATRRHPDLKVVFMSGAIAQEKSADRGAPVLSKPFGHREIRRAIGKLFETA